MKYSIRVSFTILFMLSIQSSWALDAINTKLIKQESMELQIKPEQQAKIKNILDDVDLQIKTAFKGEEPLQNEMQEELKKIVNITDETAREAATLAYQNKYKIRYQAVLTKGKINLAGVAARFNGAVPEMEFSITPDLTIKAKSRISSLTATQNFDISNPAQQNAAVLQKSLSKTNKSQTTNTTQAIPQAPTVKTLVFQDFTIIKELGCGSRAGSEVSVSGGNMTNKGAAIIAGGCRNSGEYNYVVEVLSGQKVKVDVTYDLTGFAFAAGIGGAALSTANANMSLINLTGNSPANVHCSAFAIFGWIASEACEVLNGRRSVTIPTPGVYSFYGRTRTEQGALMGGSYSEARIKNMRVILTTSPNP